jgi:hypothetical protein
VNPVPIIFDVRVNSMEGEDIFQDPKDNSLWTKTLAPGMAWWVNGSDDKRSGLRFVCPCGCGSVGFTPIRPGYTGSSWQWDGNEAQPTLTPSIQKLTPCRWHGYLTKGEFKSV